MVNGDTIIQIGYLPIKYGTTDAKIIEVCMSIL